MTNIEKLQNLLQYGESERVEFKLDRVRNEHLAKELGALANFRGGTLFLGIDDSGRAVGLTRHDNEERLQNIAFTFDPPLKLRVSKIQFKGTAVLAVQIDEIGEKPYVYRSANRNIFYTRSGSTSREATRSEIRRMYQASSEVHYEISPVPETSVKDLEIETIKKYFVEYKKIKVVETDKKENTKEKTNEIKEARFLSLTCNAGFLSENGNATILGLAFFRKESFRLTPAFSIKIINYQGTGKEIIKQKKEFQYNLFTDIPRMLQYFDLFNGVRMDLSAYKRLDIPQIPEPAFREGLLNAVIHRDYSMHGASIMIEVYENRLEILSPGGLPNTQTTEKIIAGMVYQRNPNFAKILYEMGFGEGLGLGIDRIFNSMRENGNATPVLEDGGSYFRLILPKNT